MVFRITSFFALFSALVVSCANTQIQSDFYQGLIVRSNSQDVSQSVELFEKALASPNVYIRQAAAEELAGMMTETDLAAGTLRQVRREASGWWEAVFNIDRRLNKENVLDLLLNIERTEAIPNEAVLYIRRECEKQGIIFSESEIAAIEGHFAVSRLRYNEALALFRTFQEDGNWPAQIPRLFLTYPVLINDLGRAFQYTASGTEGMSLFLQWERNLAVGNTAANNEAGYRLLFFAARIARRAGQSSAALSLFDQALTYAPNAVQSDACIWYILDLTISQPSDIFIGQLERLWHNSSYFDDILERYLHILSSRREWGNAVRVFNLIQGGNSAVKAGYAWVIARAIEEGFLSDEEMQLYADPLVFYQIAYDAVNNDTSSALYYRWLSAGVLGQPFLKIHGEAVDVDDPSEALQFLQGFFTYDAVDFISRYIRQLEQELSVDELRVIARSLEQAGQYAQSIRLVSGYMNREGYSFSKTDMELLFPRPYRELVEKYAAENNIAPEILFALIRTESAFQSGVVSHAGAIGLTQLMTPTAEEMAGRIRRAGGPDYIAMNGLDLTDPETNIHIGAHYLNYLNVRFEDKLLSLLAYNGGMTRMRRWVNESELPADLFLETVIFFETRDYGRKVIGAAAVYRELYYRY